MGAVLFSLPAREFFNERERRVSDQMPLDKISQYGRAIPDSIDPESLKRFLEISLWTLIIKQSCCFWFQIDMIDCCPSTQVVGDGDDKYLIATSEQPLCAYHLEDRIYPADVPIR